VSDAEVKNINMIHQKGMYSLKSGRYIEFFHDHSEKTYDAWEVISQNERHLIDSQPLTSMTFAMFRDRVIQKAELA
jgi:hypothetical protein